MTPDDHSYDGVLADPENHDLMTILQALETLDDDQAERWLRNHPDVVDRAEGFIHDIADAFETLREDLDGYGIFSDEVADE